MTDATAATAAVPHWSRCDSKVAGPDPTAAQGAERDCEAEEAGENGDAEDRDHVRQPILALSQADANRRDTDRCDERCRVTEHQHENGRDADSYESNADDGPLGFREIGCSGVQRPSFDNRDDHGGCDERGQCREPHVPKELAAREVEVAENDEVRQVGARQEE